MTADTTDRRTRRPGRRPDGDGEDRGGVPAGVPEPNWQDPCVPAGPPSAAGPKPRPSRSDAAGAVPGRQKQTSTRSPNAGDLQVRLITDLDAAQAVAQDWLELYRASDLGNPNLHPAWVLAWYRTFVPGKDVVLLSVHAGERLVGIAPLWWMRLLPANAGPATLQLAGAGRHVMLSDTPGILTAADVHRRVVKAVADRLATVSGWSWLTLTLSPAQGWSDQLSVPGLTHVVPRVGRTCVISELAPTVAAFESGLKRNVRESIRRSTNRLKKADRDWTLTRTRPGSPDFEQALGDLIALHQRRALLSGHKRHGDVFDDPRYGRLLASAAAGLAGRDLMTIYTLRVAQRPIAAQLVVHAPGTSMLLTSGIDPDGWMFSPMALITKEIICDEIAAGRSRLNHSAGPDTGKLRWSETLATHAEFSVVRAGLACRAAFLTHSHLALEASLRRERARHRPTPGGDAPA